MHTTLTTLIDRLDVVESEADTLTGENARYCQAVEEGDLTTSRCWARSTTPTAPSSAAGSTAWGDACREWPAPLPALPISCGR
jgi:hypothetical protein